MGHYSGYHFAGWATPHGVAQPPDISRHFLATISRHATDTISSNSGKRHCLVWVNFPDSPTTPMTLRGQTGEVISVVAGNPVVRGNTSGASMSQLFTDINADSPYTSLSGLGNCDGVWCGAVLDPVGGSVILMTDKLGVRPLYFARQDGILVFSTTIRLLESLQWLRKSINLQGLAEAAACGFPIGRNTSYSEISVLPAGEAYLFGFGPEVPKSQIYWNWERLDSTEKEADLVRQRIKVAFRNAVDRRISANEVQTAFLSGGMDTRCIVAHLRQAGCEVDTINVAPAGSKDLIFGRMAAAAIGSRHHEFPTGSQTLADRQIAAMYRLCFSDAEPGKRHTVWSGDGGSLGLGHVYLTGEILNLARQGNYAAAAKSLAQHNQWSLPTRPFRKAVGKDLTQKVELAIADAITATRCNDPARSVFIFMMKNHHRNVLIGHFENMDLKRFDLIMPFFGVASENGKNRTLSRL